MMLRVGLAFCCLVFVAQASWLSLPSLALRATKHMLSFDKLPEPVEKIAEKEQVQYDDEELLDEITKTEKIKKSSNSENQMETSEDDETETVNEERPNMLDEKRESDDEVVVRDEEEDGLEVRTLKKCLSH
ncbi:hypothetical protein COOONC_26444 [Cooperia oncophora]